MDQADPRSGGASTPAAPGVPAPIQAMNLGGQGSREWYYNRWSRQIQHNAPRERRSDPHEYIHKKVITYLPHRQNQGPRQARAVIKGVAADSGCCVRQNDLSGQVRTTTKNVIRNLCQTNLFFVYCRSSSVVNCQTVNANKQVFRSDRLN